VSIWKSEKSCNRKKPAFFLLKSQLRLNKKHFKFQVKADVQVIDDELKVSGLEAVTSLIQTAKNLLRAVIEAVKLTYIASTKVKYTTLKP
jgi:hypothetical protein